jgi:acyl-CoA thioester hydrolase
MECDRQGIVFNGAYMDYLEVGQAEYFRNLGFSIYKIAQQGYFDSAVVKVEIEYKAPARVDDMLDLHVRVSHIGNTSLILNIEIYPQDSETLLTTIQSVYVGYHTDTGATWPVPDEMRELINHFEETGEVHPLEQYPALAAAAS